LRRRGFSADEILSVRRAYKMLYRQGLPFDDARAAIDAAAEASPILAPLAAFLATPGRGIVR
jgi:UDP-N-acetylglucosamine acyltransferase